MVFDIPFYHMEQRFEFEKPFGIFADANKQSTCEPTGEPLTVKLTVWAKEAARSDPHLAAVLAAWAGLPEPVKVGVVAMITDDGLLTVG